MDLETFPQFATPNHRKPQNGVKSMLQGVPNSNQKSLKNGAQRKCASPFELADFDLHLQPRSTCNFALGLDIPSWRPFKTS